MSYSLRNAFMTTTCRRGGKRHNNISDFSRWLETYRKQRLKCHCAFFFFSSLQRNLAEAFLLLVQLLIYNQHEVPVELFPNHPCAKKASVFCFHQTTELARETPKEGNATASSLCIEDNKAISEDSKPDISPYYNPNKSSVDNLDHLTRLWTRRRKIWW